MVAQECSGLWFLEPRVEQKETINLDVGSMELNRMETEM